MVHWMELWAAKVAEVVSTALERWNPDSGRKRDQQDGRGRAHI